MKNVRLWILMSALALAAPAQQVQTWTSDRGHEFQGRFVRMEMDAVVLEGTDGEEVTVPLTALSPASQELARSEAATHQKDVPFFSHKSQNLALTLHPTLNFMKLYFNDSSRPYPFAPDQVLVNLSEIVNRKYTRIAVTGLDGAPKMDAKGGEFRLKMANGVVVEIHLDVRKTDEAGVRYRMILPEDTKLPKLSLRLQMRFPKLAEYEMEKEKYVGPISPVPVSYDDLQKLLEPYSLRLGRFRAKTDTIPYGAPQERGVNGISSFSMSTPVRGNIEVQAPSDSKSGNLNIWFYSGKAPFQGYTLQFAPGEDPETLSGEFSIRIK